MSVYPHGETWWIRYRDPRGRIRRVSSESSLKREAEAVEAAIWTKIREGKFIGKTQREKVYFRKVALRVLEHVRDLKRKSAEN